MAAALAQQPEHHSMPPSSEKPPQRGHRLSLWLLALSLIIVAIVTLIYELKTSALQARFLSNYASTLTFHLGVGPSHTLNYPTHGPFDQRLGYVGLPAMLARLDQQGYAITDQVRFSQALLDYTRSGFYPPYPEKAQAGLSLYDCKNAPLYQFRYPHQGYDSFADIPPLVIDALLFIEDRRLLDAHNPHLNPAADWPRLVKASISQAAKALEIEGQSAGGSTLATQLEKFRHAPEGRTTGFTSKFQQMVSASVRTYQQGPLTLTARRNIVREYVNAVPLAAAPGFGEVNGLADGLTVWFNVDFAQTNARLKGLRGVAEQGVALRQVLALLIAQRRPSWYLNQEGRSELEALVNSHLRLLRGHGLISVELSTAALNSQSQYRDWLAEPILQSVPNHKSLVVTRNRLSQSLGVPLYGLDRLDLSASSTLDGALQEAVSTYLKSLADPATANALGLLGERLLSARTTEALRYSFTLFENTPTGALVRVQTDNTDQPFDLNESSKLELGSTAKLRVLTTYLQIISELYHRFAGLEARTLYQFDIDPRDSVSLWAANYLIANPKADLSQMLEAALNRRYSASPYEDFFTGGGVHRFNNFQQQDDLKNPTLKVALQESINLPFVRLLRDIVRYSIYQSANNSAALLKNDHDPRRAEYLARFADREGQVYMQRFWRKYQGLDEKARLNALLKGLNHTPRRLAAVYRYLYPEHDSQALGRFLEEHLAQPVTRRELDKLFAEYRPGRFSLPDQGYTARVHPLELWVLGYSLKQPQASLDQVLKDSYQERQAVYGWLFKTRHKGARDSRIRTLLEVEAFVDIHQRWQQLGYPFGHLVPSLATALGSSGDRPGALAELMGIIQNDGVRLPSVRIDTLSFASDTPYATRLAKRQDLAVRVMHPEVAQALRNVLADVVSQGTARRIAASFNDANGIPLAIGGKTGTGDNRLQKIGAGGQLLSSTALNRTATFVFYLGERYYGTLTAFVPGPQAQDFGFTSALPVQVLKGMAPMLAPYLNGQMCR